MSVPPAPPTVALIPNPQPTCRRPTVTYIETHDLREELDFRANGGIEVTLIWRRADNSVSVAVFDTNTEEQSELRIDASEALDAFHHPFAYAARQRIETTPYSARLAQSGDASGLALTPGC
jgi:hypothetical protein